MTQSELDAARKQIRNLLPDALRSLLLHYQDYLDSDYSHEPKEFTAYHNAGKNALTHIQLLLKVYHTLSDANDLDSDLRSELASVMAELEEEDV